jgi:hypothetical protein
MEHSLTRYKLKVFWDDEYKHLEYINEPFNDFAARDSWMAQGYPNRFTGDMCDMRSAATHVESIRFVEHFAVFWDGKT